MQLLMYASRPVSDTKVFNFPTEKDPPHDDLVGDQSNSSDLRV